MIFYPFPFPFPFPFPPIRRNQVPLPPCDVTMKGSTVRGGPDPVLFPEGETGSLPTYDDFLHFPTFPLFPRASPGPPRSRPSLDPPWPLGIDDRPTLPTSAERAVSAPLLFSSHHHSLSLTALYLHVASSRPRGIMSRLPASVSLSPPHTVHVHPHTMMVGASLRPSAECNKTESQPPSIAPRTPSTPHPDPALPDFHP